MNWPNHEIHACGDKCICPVHKIRFFYSTWADVHACQIKGCIYKHGFEIYQEDYINEFRSNDVRAN